MNFVEGTVSAAEGAAPTVNIGGNALELRQPLPGFKPGDKVTFGIRPEHMGVTDAAGVKLADVRVDLVEQLGDATMLYASTRGGQPITISLDGQRQIAAGSTVPAYVDPTKYHVFAPDGRAI